MDMTITAPRVRPACHALVWVAWAGSALVVVQVTDGVLPKVVLLGVALVVVEARAAGGLGRRTFVVLVAMAAVFALLRVVLTALTTHPSSDDVLVRLPAVVLPSMLGGFTVGGTIHHAVVIRSLGEGLAIVAVISVLAAFNAVVIHSELLMLLPRAFHELGLAVTVALAFVPTVIDSAREVRESAIARAGPGGRRVGVRWLLAVLETALERSTRLAESLDSRGLGHRGPSRTEQRAAKLAVGGMVLFIGAFAALVGRHRPVAFAMGLAGALLVVVAVRSASRATARPRYRPRPVLLTDRALIGWSVVLAAVVMLGEARLPNAAAVLAVGFALPGFVGAAAVRR